MRGAERQRLCKALTATPTPSLIATPIAASVATTTVVQSDLRSVRTRRGCA